MKSKNSTLRKLFSITAIFVLAILASLSAFYFNISPAYSLSVDNANFSNNMSDSTNTPASPSSYTFVDSSFKTVSYNPQSTTANQPKITAGVVNIESQGYTKRSSDMDNFALMISSKKDNVSNTVKYGYASSQFTLAAESYYSVSVDIYVDNAEKLACLYLIDENNTVYASYKQIGSANRWTTFMFLIKTDDFSSTNLKLAMFLEGNGTVLFDSVSINEVNKTELENLKTRYPSTSKSVEPATDNVVSQQTFSRSMFTAVETSAKTTIENSNVNDNAFASSVKITNTEAAHAKYETASNFLTFEQNRNYRFTVSAKATNLSGNIKLHLVQTNLEKDDDGNYIYDTDNNHTITISANTSQELTNGFKKYSFFINSHPLKTTTFKLVVELGDDSTQTEGSIYLAGFVLTSVNYTNYENASTGDNAQKVDVSTKITNNSDIKSLFLTNGSFNTVKNTNSSKTYPVAPASWTVTTGNNTQLYGVVNTSETEFDKFVANNSFTSAPVNPGNSNGLVESNNVLMMYNSVTDTISYTSEKDKSLEAKTYHRFSINVLTQHSTLNLYLVANINNQEVVLSSLKNIATDGAWHNVDLYIYTGIHQLEVGVKAEMNSNGFGYAYLDDATFDYAHRSVGEFLTQPTQAQFDAIQTSSNGKLHISKVDLSNIIEADSTSRYATPIHFGSNTNANVDFGVVDTANDADVRFILNENQNIQNFKSVDNSKILAIHAVDYVAQTYTSNIGYRFESNKYYLVKVKVYTQNLSSEKENFGLGLALSNFDEKFSNINTETENSNGWTTYNFYINSSDTTTSMLKLIFGNEEANLKGDAFIGDIVVDEIEEANFVETPNSTTLVLKSTTKNDDNNNNKDENSNKTKNSNNTAWIIAIPSILTGAAIVLAIVGVALRKVKFKKPVKKTKNAYDRNSKQSQQIYMRKATMLREERLRELQQQLETLQNERATYETQYKKDLSSLRQLKIKRAPASEIAKLEKDMKQNQKHSAQIGSSIRSVELEIDFTNSNEYIKQVVKKLSSAKQDEQEQDNQ